MTIFLTLAALMTLAALAAIVPAFLKKHRGEALDRDRQNIAIARERLGELEAEHKAGNLSDDSYAQAKAEFEKLLADDLGTEGAAEVPAPASGRWMLGFFAVLLPLAAFALYMELGAPQHLHVAGASAGAVPSPSHGGPDGKLPSVEEMVASLEAKLAQEPDNAEGWYLLGRTYMSTQRYEDAAMAFGKVNELVPDQPAVLISLADATAMAQAGRITGAPAELVARALVLDPDNVTALWLAGKAEAEAGNNAEALKYWRRVLTLSIDDPQTQAEMRVQIAELERESGLSPAASEGSVDSPSAEQVMPVASSGAVEAPPAEQAMPAASGGPAITVNVSLDPSVMDQAGAGDTVFIYARALQGPPMPLAVARHQVSDLPLSVTLTDEMAMMPQMKLSSFPSVRISARVSRSGNAITQPGDLVSEDARIEVANNAPVTLVIDRAVP